MGTDLLTVTPAWVEHSANRLAIAGWESIAINHPELSVLLQTMLGREAYAKDAAATAQSTANDAHAHAVAALGYLGSLGTDMLATDDDGLAIKIKNRTGAATVKGQVVQLHRTLREMSGDAGAQCSAWATAGESEANTDAGQLYFDVTVPNTVTYYYGGLTDAPTVYHYHGVTDAPTVYHYEGVTDAPVVLYWELTVDAPVVLYWSLWLDGADATVTVYSDAAMTVAVAEGALVGDGGGAIVLAEVGGSGITGTVTVAAGITPDTGTLSILDDVITEGGDSLAQCSLWTIVGEAQTMTTVNVYSDAAKTVLECTGTVDHDTGGAIVLAATGAISGTVTVDADAVEDTDGANTLSCLDDVITPAGDALGQLTLWTVVGEAQTLYTVNVYDDLAHTTLLCTGTVDHDTGGVAVVLAEFGGSGISGTVDVVASAVDSTANANTLSILDDAITEGGDAGAAFANWTIAGEPQTMYTVTVYDDVGHTTVLCQGTVDHSTGGAGVVLAEVGGSGISGTVDVAAAADDSVADGNTLSILDDVITEAGDATNEFLNWAIAGEPQTLYTVSVYDDVAHTTLLAQGTVDHDTGGIAVVLAAVPPSTVALTVDVIASATDSTADGNTLSILDDIITEGGDAGNCFANWTCGGYPPTMYTLSVYSDDAGAHLLCHVVVDHVAGGAGLVLASDSAELVTGTVDVIALATDDAVAAANTLTITAGVLVEAGDAGGCFSNWTIAGSDQTHVYVYMDAAKTVVVCHGSIDNTTGGTITLAAVGGSGLTGTVVVIPAAIADAAADNILSYSYGGSFQLTPANGDDVAGVVYEAGVADGADTWVTIAGKAYVLREPLSGIAASSWVRTGATTPGYCESEWDFAAARAQQQIGYALERVAAGGAATVLVELARR